MALDPNDATPPSLDAVMPLVYDELRRLARHYLRKERGNHTLQPTALVNEAYLSLAQQHDVAWQSRGHFLAIAARTMRHVLVDHARERGALKRGGDLRQVTFHSWIRVEDRDVDVMALDEALDKLDAFDPSGRRVVELRYFGGLTIEETAEVLDVSPATVKRHWTLVKAWLFRELQSSSAP